MTASTPGETAPVDIERVAAADLDLAVAQELAAVGAAAMRRTGIEFPVPVAASLLGRLQLGWEGEPVAGIWLARQQGRVVGYGEAHFPARENTRTAHLDAVVHPDHRRRGIGRRLHEAILAEARPAGRPIVYAGAFEGTDGPRALAALRYRRLGQDAVRLVRLHGSGQDRWQRLYDEAAGRAAAYELVRMAGPVPADLVPDLVDLHEAINDAPRSDPDSDPDSWTAERVRATSSALERRRQSVYRVLARHRATGAWAGQSLLCVDEHRPAVAFQEDTAVVRAHRGHRLGLLMKADMLRWLGSERPDVTATITWNDVGNTPMIAVNEQLGATVVAVHTSCRLRE